MISGMKCVKGVIRKVRDAIITIFTNLTLIVTLRVAKIDPLDYVMLSRLSPTLSTERFIFIYSAKAHQHSHTIGLSLLRLTYS